MSLVEISPPSLVENRNVTTVYYEIIWKYNAFCDLESLKNAMPISSERSFIQKTN